MTQTLSFPLLALLASVTLAGTAQAGCYADYKAKRDDPLKLHYGVAQVTGACEPEVAEAELTDRLATDGWVLLTVLSVFDEGGLQERKDSAGRFFLRY